MRKIFVATIGLIIIVLSLTLVSLQSSRVFAQNAPTPTEIVQCAPKTAMDEIGFLLKSTDNEAQDVALLKQARDIIDAQISACNFPTETPTPTDTKVGTLDPNEGRTATRAALNDNRTATSTVKTATASFIAAYKTIARGELASYADKHVGEKIKIQGRVFNILDDQTLQIFLSDGITAVFVESTTSFSGIYENDNVTIYGTIVGYKDGQNTVGGTIHQPLIAADLITKN